VVTAISQQASHSLRSDSLANNKSLDTFAALGLCEWMECSCKMMGFREPYPIQEKCIPAILDGRDVMGCAETGSGKTAAFALPILQKLSEDPYGIFAVILTPTRELAIQINEQFNALGAATGVRTALVIGGESIMSQGAEISRRPHVIIATPGRLRHHIQSADPPHLSKTKFLVLDEADRLLTVGFESELQAIISAMSPQRQTLLFSATLNSTLLELEQLAMKDTLRFDLTREAVIPTTLVQQYLFMPVQVKLCYLVAVLRGILGEAEEQDDEKSSSARKRGKKRHADHLEKLTSQEAANTATKSSVIIFTNSCKRCQSTAETLRELQVDCVEMHSMLSQNRRLASLGKFKSQLSRILIATDLAGRGLDIPHVDHVINLDMPTVASDYVHRVGRTARAGRSGRSLSFITQYDVELVHNIEALTGVKMTVSTEVNNDDIRDLLNPVSKAMHAAQMKMQEYGFDEKSQIFLKRKRKQKRRLLRKNRLKENDS